MPELPFAAGEFPGSATVITAEEIARSGAASVPALLSRVAGVQVSDTHGFGLGADSTVNLRGVVNSSRTNALVLVDGVRQNRVTGDEVHWQGLPLEQIERIEILRGGGSLIYGEGALAGLINIVTKKGGERFLTTTHGAEVGSFGQERYFTAARGQAGPLTYGTSFHRSSLSGYRESTMSRTTTVTGHLGWLPLPELRLETNLLHSEDTTGFAGGITQAQTEARRRQRGTFPGLIQNDHTQVSIDASLIGSSGWSMAANTFFSVRETDSDTGSRFATITPTKGFGLRGSHSLETDALRHTFVSGIDLLDEKASTGLRESKFAESNKASYGLFAEETLRLWDRATVSAGLRFDKARFHEDLSFPLFEGALRFEGWSPKAAVSVDLAEPLTAYASYARPFKSPNVDDFAAAIPGTQFVGNIDLEPQQADDYTLGLRFQDDRVGTAEASWFHMRISDEILFNDLPGNDQNQNFDTSRTGLELSASPRLPLPGLTGTITYTFLEAEFHRGAFKGNTLPGTPEHQLSAALSYEVIPHAFLTLDWLLVQDAFRINDFNNVLPADNYGVLSLGGRLEHEHFTAYFRIENVTNEEYTTFQSSTGVAVSTGENPAPPLTVLGGITVTF